MVMEGWVIKLICYKTLLKDFTPVGNPMNMVENDEDFSKEV
jgi:hypothetical protein